MAIAVVLAFIMALITASSNVILKKGFKEVPPLLAVYISVVISTIFLWIATYLFVPRYFFSNYKGILIFIIIGSFAPNLVRTLTYLGIHRLGAGMAAPLRALTPFFATIIAIRFLKESPKSIIFIGISLIVLGIIVLSKKDSRDFVHWRPVHFLYPLGAAFMAGVAANLRKYGLNLMPQAIFASAIAATSSLVFLSGYVMYKYDIRKSFRFIRCKHEFKLIIIASLLTACGEIVDLSALLFGKVSLVIPIFAATPLVIVFLSRIFLKEHEIVTARLMIATILILCGIYMSIVSAL